MSNPRPWKFVFENGRERDINIYVCLYKKKIFGKELIAFNKELDLRSQFEAISFFDERVGSHKRFTVNVVLRFYKQVASSWKAKVKIQVETKYPTIVKYNFEVRPNKMFRRSEHPSLILSSPLLMLSPSDLAKPDVPCDSSTHNVIDCRGNIAFHCRVVHSSTALLSAAEVIDESDQVVATTHTISPSTLPRMDDVEDHKNSIVLNQEEGERAMLIRGNQDWAVCIGHWQRDSKAAAMSKPKEQYFVGIEVYKLSGKRGWCSVRKSSGGVFHIKVDSDTTVTIDLKANKVEIPPQAPDIPEVLALAFSLSILHLLFIPKLSYDKCSPASHDQTSSCPAIPSSFHSAGYGSTNVTTNAYLGVGNKEATAETVAYGCSDFNEDFFWNECSQDPLVSSLTRAGENDAGGRYRRQRETGGGGGYGKRRGYRRGRETGGGGGYRERRGSGGSESDHGCDRRESNRGGSEWEGLERRDSGGSEGGHGCERRESCGGGGGWEYSGGGGSGGGFDGGGSIVGGEGCDGGYED